jgi:hypothetical protein
MWWVFVAVGIAWMIVSALVLRMDTASRTTIGALLGVIFLASAADEFFIGYVRKSWRWAHAILGVLFVAGASGASRSRSRRSGRSRLCSVCC